MICPPNDPLAAAETLPPRHLDLLDRLQPHERSLLLSKFTQRSAPAGTILFTQGAKRSVSFFIESGLVRTFYVSPLGKEVTVGYCSSGDLVGGPYFCDDDCMHVWSGEAVNDSVVFSITGHDLKAVSKQIPAVADCLINALSFKLYRVSMLLQTRYTESVFHRLAQLLLNLAQMYGKPCKEGVLITHPFTQEDLANMVGASRQWVNTTFGQLQREGVVSNRKRQLIIHDLSQLREKSHQ